MIKSDIDLSNDKLAVTNIQRTCVHDGPGIRTLLFFKGCNMRCKWCQNPESQTFQSPGKRLEGSSVAELVNIIRQDRDYYINTHGGVTFSGGEAMMQHRGSLVALLKALKEDRINVAVETAGDAPWKNYEAVLPYVDLFLFDLKVIGDDELHMKLVGRHFKLVEENLRKLIAAGANIQFRMCVVPGHNDAEENIKAAADFLISLGRPSISLLRYYNMHESKAKRLGLARESLHITNEQAVSALERVRQSFESHGVLTDCADLDQPRRPPEFTQRVWDIRKALRDAGYSLCLETATLKTAFYKENGFTEPVKVQRGNLLRYLLNNKSIAVYPDELLVGNFTSKRVGAQLWVEYTGSTSAGIIYNCDRAKPVAFKLSRAEKANFYLKIAPFWAMRSLVTKIFPTYGELGLYAARLLERKVGFENNMMGVSHFIVNNERLLKLGTEGMKDEVRARQKENSEGHADFYEGVLIALTGLEEFADRYAAHLLEMSRSEDDSARRAELREMSIICSRVPRYPARTFHEALQSILFMEIGLCMEAFENAISFGRLDQFLYPYYKADIEAGRLTMEKAKELVACFVLKVDELIFANDGDTGFQFGKLFESLSAVETITVGGVDSEGHDATNDISYMILDACELGPIAVNMAARIHRKSPEKYIRRIAEVYRNGTPMPELFNDEVYIPALIRNYPMTTIEQARNYAIVGCVEPCASSEHYGNTDCANVNLAMPFLQAIRGEKKDLWKYGILDGLDKEAINFAKAKLLGRPYPTPEKQRVSNHYNPPTNMDELMTRFEERLNHVTSAVLADHFIIETALAKNFNVPLASSLYESAVKSGKCLLEGGATINTSGIQAIAVTDVADSLLAIDELVFKRKAFTMAALLNAMDENFEGEHNRQIKAELLAIPKFGDDSSPEIIYWMDRVLDLWVKALAACKSTRNGRYVAGYYGLNVNKAYGKNTPALPSGRLAGVPLANSLCPHYGMKSADLTSALNAVSRLNFAKYAPNGTTVTSTIDSGLFPGENGINNLAGLIKGYFDQGGMQFQPNVVSRDVLMDAYNNPEKYPNLIVRIAGYCAYFNDLSDELKMEIINRSYYSDDHGES